jgi:hypothetical protein
VVRIASQLTDVARRLATVYDQLAPRLLDDGCPVRHPADSVLSAGDQLRLAGTACRYARSVLAEESGDARLEPSSGALLYMLGLVVITTHPGRFWLGMALAGIPTLIGPIGTLIGGERWRRL